MINNLIWPHYGADSIGKCCFAVNINLDDEDGDQRNDETNKTQNKLRTYESQFLKNMNKMMSISMIQFILFINLPKFIRNNLIGFRFFPNDSIEFFSRLIDCMITERKSLKNQYIDDFLQFLFEHNDDYLASTGKSVSSTLRLNSNEIVAQCLIFMVSTFSICIAFFRTKDAE